MKYLLINECGSFFRADELKDLSGAYEYFDIIRVETDEYWDGEAWATVEELGENT